MADFLLVGYVVLARHIAPAPMTFVGNAVLLSWDLMLSSSVFLQAVLALYLAHSGETR